MSKTASVLISLYCLVHYHLNRTITNVVCNTGASRYNCCILLNTCCKKKKKGFSLKENVLLID